MRLTIYPSTMPESFLKLSIFRSIIKFLFVLGVGFVVFVITSKTYVPPAGMDHNYERIIQVFETAPPVPF